MKLIEIIYLALILATVIAGKWFFAAASNFLYAISFLFFVWMIYAYFIQDKTSSILSKLFMIYYRSLFLVGLIFILHAFPGMDAIMITVIGLAAGYLVFSLFSKHPNKKAQWSTYIYMQAFILLYFMIPMILR